MVVPTNHPAVRDHFWTAMKTPRVWDAKNGFGNVTMRMDGTYPILVGGGWMWLVSWSFSTTSTPWMRLAHRFGHRFLLLLFMVQNEQKLILMSVPHGTSIPTWAFG